MYAKIQNNTVVEYPIVNLRQAFPNVSFPADILDRHLPDGVVRVHNAAYPQHNPATEKVVQRPLLELVGDQWQTAFDVVPLSDTELAERSIQAREAAKVSRATAVEAIKVTTAAGNTFDGDETAQGRMSRAILVLSTGAAASVPWVLADNTVIQADIAELTEALALAGAEQARLWIL